MHLYLEIISVLIISKKHLKYIIDSKYLFIMQKQEEDSEIQFSDDQQLNEQSIVPKPMAEVQIPQDTGLSVRQKQGYEVLYIVFTTYRKEVEELSAKYHCHIRVSMSSYLISNIDSSKKDEFGQCCKQIADFMNSISFVRLGAIGSAKGPLDLNEKMRYSHSPYFSELLKNKNINLISFQEEVVAFSRKLAKDEIKHAFIAITKDSMIFPVKFSRSLRNGVKVFHTEIYKQINMYIEKMFKYYQQFLKERKVTAEINKTKAFIYLIGERQKYLMDSKCTIKNVLESMVCLVIKNTKINDNTLIKFLEKASTYPIHFGRIGEKDCIIISKDNILKQLIYKSAGFFKHTGISLLGQNQGNISANTKIGIFIIRTSTFKIKIQNARTVCKEIGYDLFYTSGVHYVTQVFYQQGSEKKDVMQKLLGDIMQALENKKQKFETMTKMKTFDKNKNEKDENPLKYIPKGGREIDKNLSKLLRRDVLTERVQMKKQYNIAYNLIETKEQVQYWILEASGDAGAQIEEKDLKPGKYLKGLKRVGEDGSTAAIYEQIITVI